MRMRLYRVSDGAVSEYVEACSPEEALDVVFDGYDWGLCQPFVPRRPGECRPADEFAVVWEVTPNGEQVERLRVHLTELGAPTEKGAGVATRRPRLGSGWGDRA